MKYNIVWKSQYGKEVVDSTDTKSDAEYLLNEYRMAYNEGFLYIARGK